MPTVAVICEYNLFHNGHARLFGAIRERYGADTTIVSIMSGNFTQRGIPAATDKYTRAHAAMLCGSDLTLELPVPYCCSVAQRFAWGAVGLAAALGGIDYLAFGSECGDLDALTEVAQRRADGAFDAALSDALAHADADESYLRVRERVYAQLYGAVSLAPNDQLAVEYLTALRQCAITPSVFARTGDETATAARGAYLSGDSAALARIVPECTLPLYRDACRASEAYLSRAVLWQLRAAQPEQLAQYADVTQDLAYRLCRMAGECADLSELLCAVPTKKYTRARVRRCVLACMLGITDAHFAVPPAYTLVLSAGARGRALLSDLRKSASVPIYTKGVQVTDALAQRSDALYTLAMEKAAGAGVILRKSPTIEK